MDKKKVYYRLVGPDGTVYSAAGERWLLEEDLARGDVVRYTHGECRRVVFRLPPGCNIVSAKE